ncbi:MAG: hypothetical protein RH862_14390 [Leptospiraceae bacterium]
MNLEKMKSRLPNLEILITPAANHGPWSPGRRKSEIRSSFIKSIITILAFLLLSCSEKESSEPCSGDLDPAALSTIQGLWAPDARNLPDGLNERGQTQLLKSRIQFSKAGYGYHADGRPIHRVPLSGLSRDGKTVHVFLRSGNGQCEEMKIELLDRNSIRLILSEDYPVIRYKREKNHETL